MQLKVKSAAARHSLHVVYTTARGRQLVNVNITENDEEVVISSRSSGTTTQAFSGCSTSPVTISTID